MLGCQLLPAVLSLLPQLDAGPSSWTLPLGPECRGGCSVLAMLSSPRADVVPEVPTSLLYDPLRPFVASAELFVNVIEVRGHDTLHACMYAWSVA